MDDVTLQETRDLLKQIRKEILLRQSVLRPVHLIHCRRSESRNDTAAVRPRNEGDEMDGDRPLVDGRDLLESKIKDFIYEAFICGRYTPHKSISELEREKLDGYFERLHELLIHYLDRATGNACAQDEDSETREVGDGVRPKPHLIPRDPNAFVVDEWDPIKKITDEFAREMELRLAYDGKRVAIGHCDLTKKPDGSIHAHIEYYPQDKKSDDGDTDE